MASVRIKSTPPGEAPPSIREAWVGLVLPVFRKNPGYYLASGVLTGPRSVMDGILNFFAFRFQLQRGFAVPSLVAVEILEKSKPDAARWWRENAPRTIRPRRYFVFSAECCEPVE
jgi:hypothetical protein